MRETGSGNAAYWAEDAYDIADRLRRLTDSGLTTPQQRHAHLLDISRTLRELSQRSRALSSEARMRAERLRLSASAARR